MSQDTTLPPMLPLPKPYSVAAAHGLDDLHTGDSLIAYAQIYARAVLAAQVPRPCSAQTSESERQAVLSSTDAPQQAQGVPKTFPAEIWGLLAEVADRKGSEYTGPWEGPDGEPLQDAADAAIAWILPRTAAPQAEPQPEREPTTWSRYVAGMIACYLKWPDGDERTEAVARIIERRRWSDRQPEREPLSQSATDVLAERQRQISVEGWTSAHDDDHSHGEMANAASAYAWGANYPTILGAGNPPDSWPWGVEWWRPCDPRRMLVKAGALILAEIERLDRLAGIGTKGGDK